MYSHSNYAKLIFGPNFLIQFQIYPHFLEIMFLSHQWYQEGIIEEIWMKKSGENDKTGCIRQIM